MKLLFLALLCAVVTSPALCGPRPHATFGDKGLALPVRPATRKSKVEKVLTVERVWSATWCASCPGLKQDLKDLGPSLLVYRVAYLPAEIRVVPTVVYSDGTTDTGTKAIRRKAKLPDPIPVYEATGYR